MADSLLVFQEGKSYFGLFADHFAPPYAFNLFWVQPSGYNPAIWHFEKSDHSMKGVMLHLGGLFGVAPVVFDHQGHLFIRQVKNEASGEVFRAGIYLRHFVTRLPKDKAQERLQSLERITDLPPDIPRTAVRSVIGWGRKKIILIDPELVLRSYRIINDELQLDRPKAEDWDDWTPDVEPEPTLPGLFEDLPPVFGEEEEEDFPLAPEKPPITNGG